MIIPKEIWRLIDALWNGRALKEKDLFVSANADPKEVRIYIYIYIYVLM
jgi:hypothetical protein